MIHVGDCLEVMRTLEANSFDSIVTDPPYGIGFMGKAWDGKDIADRHRKRQAMPSQDPTAWTESGGHKSAAAAAGAYDLSPHGMRAFQSWTADWAREAFRVLKPGGHIVVFAAPRTYHRMACGIEEAGFELRDQIMWLFGSGFPKSRNLDGEWDGWGTALKPAHEPICLARKPLDSTVAGNVARWGVGALNIDGCRVLTDEDLSGGAYSEKGARTTSPALSPSGMNRPGATAGTFVQPEGRWPANLIHDGSDEVMAAFPQAPGQQGDLKQQGHAVPRGNAFGQYGPKLAHAARNDSGSAARFFYCAKASRADRNDGLDDPGPQFKAHARPCDYEAVNSAARGNHHPTVKPTDLMRWLCRLVTPAGGRILDPFTGSGSTGRGAVAEGFQFVGIELDADYARIAEARIRAMHPGLALAMRA